jgi:hypothetical protein
MGMLHRGTGPVERWRSFVFDCFSSPALGVLLADLKKTLLGFAHLANPSQETILFAGS